MRAGSRNALEPEIRKGQPGQRDHEGCDGGREEVYHGAGLWKAEALDVAESSAPGVSEEMGGVEIEARQVPQERPCEREEGQQAVVSCEVYPLADLIKDDDGRDRYGQLRPDVIQASEAE